MKTTFLKKEKEDVLVYPGSSLDENSVVQFLIHGQRPERSFEDRSVYFEMESGRTSNDGVSMVPDTSFHMWFDGEDAIEFGMKLIEHGKYALEANMIQHQQIHMENNLRKFVSEDRVEEIEFEMIDGDLEDYGQGFKLFRITPIWNDGMAPEYQEDFSYEKVIYWFTLEPEFHDQLDYYTGGVSYSFVGYDHDEEVRKFNEQIELMSNNEIS